MEFTQSYQILLNSFLITFNLLLPETTMMFSREPSKLLKSTLLTLLLKMRLMQATMLTLFKKKTFASKDDLVSNLVPENILVSENEAFRSHLVNYSNITNDPHFSQLFGKEDIHSKDKMTIMGIDYARLSLKTQSILRSVVAMLPIDIQLRILESKAMFRSFDLWFKGFKKIVTATIPNPVELDEGDNVFLQLEWEEHFGSTLRVYEEKHPFPGLLINYDDSSYIVADSDDDDDDDRDPYWLSQMFEYGFIRFIRLTSHFQASQLPQIIQDAIKGFNNPFVSIICWSTLPKWERENWMNVQPSKDLILINGHTHQGPWFEGNSQLSFTDPFTLAECWRNYFNNQIINVAQNLWKNYHFMGSTNRISVFGPKPYSDAIAHLWVTDHCNPRRLLVPGKTPVFEPILYCGFCNQYAIYHEHECDSPQGPFDPFDGYPSDAPSTD